MSLPKVLIIGQPFNNNTGGGITLTNLFSGWDRDKIAVACSGYLLLDNIDPTVCNTYYQLGNKEHKWIFPFNLLKRKYPSGLIKFNGQKVYDLTIPKSKLRIKIIMNFLYPFLKYIGLYHCIEKTELSEDFCNWVNDYKPDIVYTQASSRNAVLFCISVHNSLKKPFIFHMMDDWPALIGNKGFFRKYWHKKIDSELRILLEKASLLMSISDYMTHEYKKRYGKYFVAFHNPIDIEFWGKYQKDDYKLGDSPTILYAGKTSLGVKTSLEIVAKAIQYINDTLNMSIKFNLQIKENPSWITKYSCVERKSFVPYNDLPKVFSEADFLILPYDFSRESIKYVQYSMPTKATEFMISGTPIILFAPKETAIVKYCQLHDCAKIITENNIQSFANSIKDLINNESERLHIAKNAKRLANEKHNSLKVTNDFERIIKSLVIEQNNA